MTSFMIHFLIDNLFISGIIGILLISKRILKNVLTIRMQYNLWFLLLGFMVVPFIKLPLNIYSQITFWLNKLTNISLSSMGDVTEKSTNINMSYVTNQMNDFVLSVSRETPSIIWQILFAIWIVGILIMIIFILKSLLRLNTLKKSSLPLQNKKIRQLYNDCLDEINITTDIPIYSTVFLKSPITVGLFRPYIYLPIHLISDYHVTDTEHITATEMRYILLHELQHYKHKDALVNYLMNISCVLYWFNPFVWYALKEMRIEREMACDASVLKMLKDDDYEKYGNTLINFAEKISLNPFPFTAGINGDMKQMRRRIVNISSYEKPTFHKKFKGVIAYTLITILLLGFVPILSTYAAYENHYRWGKNSNNISYIDLSTYFGEYEGSFVLYDMENDTWSIYNFEYASLRVAPNSTYKIYDALFGLEEEIITPDYSFISWNNEMYPFDEWNSDQTLQSAMSNSVNWYFQTIDEQLGADTLNSYVRKIGYGNENISGNLSSYWMESYLKISPIEQVELLIKLHDNSFGFAPKNINVVKDSIRLSSTMGIFYGKTGTGRVNEHDVNGWFIGYLETVNSTYFFATNILAEDNATGSNAAEITLSILSELT